MKYSDITKLKHLAQDKVSRSANPAIVRNSTVFFKSMQELLEKEKVVKKGLKVNFYEYGRAGSQTTIALQNFIAELELAYATFLTSIIASGRKNNLSLLNPSFINWSSSSCVGQVILKTFSAKYFQYNLLKKCSFRYPDILRMHLNLPLKILFNNRGKEVIK